MGASQTTGGSLRDHLKRVWLQTGFKPPELTEIECPDAIRHVWMWFMDLSRTRGSGAVSINPITYTEICAWSRLSKNRPTPFEIECITAVDSLFLNNIHKDA